MKVDGLAPGQGNPADRAGAAKRPAPAPGKSFADLLKKAQGDPAPRAPEAQAAQPAPEAAKPADAAPPPPADDHLGAIRQRLQAGYYNTQKVDDALSDKLSGYFDEIA